MQEEFSSLARRHPGTDSDTWTAQLWREWERPLESGTCSDRLCAPNFEVNADTWQIYMPYRSMYVVNLLQRSQIVCFYFRLWYNAGIIISFLDEMHDSWNIVVNVESLSLSMDLPFRFRILFMCNLMQDTIIIRIPYLIKIKEIINIWNWMSVFIMWFCDPIVLHSIIGRIYWYWGSNVTHWRVHTRLLYSVKVTDNSVMLQCSVTSFWPLFTHIYPFSTHILLFYVIFSESKFSSYWIFTEIENNNLGCIHPKFDWLKLFDSRSKSEAINYR